ncbi:uncharacterized protein ACA1_369170 [Acanthamoeba castellanii str. Neff]|uniref:Uncharacterized protein n=1 Tax=Acanthamoeba castellanii (strain ATCC 30010 / Neff) TaxID=1257118 RepID=L8GYX8_ACACF|nr:uncharacterized protein ACA1_369170 [Acanthamoeba castellanii str. Neff]ELR18185.1 hypothetical protein ACA1_369170 [Acanthamoeba castellanii str. Neff]
MCALYIKTREDIDLLHEINGLSIERIEARARPLEDRTQDATEWMYRSHTGFLSEGESLKAVRELYAARNATNKCADRQPIKHEGEVTYDVADVPGNKIKVTRTFYMGEQFSLFFNPERHNSPDNQTWVENVHSGLSLCVGGDMEKGLVTYIHHYGFYEGGGASNAYRIDPALLVALLTGSITQDCVDVVSAKQG